MTMKCKDAQYVESVGKIEVKQSGENYLDIGEEMMREWTWEERGGNEKSGEEIRRDVHTHLEQ